MVNLRTIFYLFSLLASCVSNEMAVSISTHVLDTALGRPAEGIPTILERLGPNQSKLTNITSKDGRIRFPDGSFTPGTYTLRFEVADYFAKQNVSTLYPYIEVGWDEHPTTPDRQLIVVSIAGLDNFIFTLLYGGSVRFVHS